MAGNKYWRLRVGRGFVRAGVVASSLAQAELRPTVILHRMEADGSRPTDREAVVRILQLLNS